MLLLGTSLASHSSTSYDLRGESGGWQQTDWAGVWMMKAVSHLASILVVARNAQCGKRTPSLS